MAGNMTGLARDLQRWSAKLERSGYGAPTQRDVLDFRTCRAVATWLVRDMRPDIGRRVGGRTLDAGKGRKKRGVRAGVWAAPHSVGNVSSWWVGGTGKLHWLDQGTSAHDLTRKTRRRGKKKTPPVMMTPKGPRVGPFRHHGSRGDSIYWRTRAKHQARAMEQGAAYVQGELVRAVLPEPVFYTPGTH